MNGSRFSPAGLVLVMVLIGLSWANAQEDGKNLVQKYAVIVGIEDYEHENLRLPQPLKYPVDDAEALSDVLIKSGYDVTLLTDNLGKTDRLLEPNKENIDRAIKMVLAKCQRDDLVVVAFAGHGLQFDEQPDAYFCPKDARPFKNKTETLVSMTAVYSELEASNAAVKIVLIDACRSDPDPARGRDGLNADNAPRPPRGVGALFSCSAGQRSFEHDELQHGVFFSCVLDGLAGKAADRNNMVTFDDLSKYVRIEVPVRMKNLIPQRVQSPNMKADLVGVPVLLEIFKPSSPIPAGLVAPFSALEAAASQAVWAEYHDTQPVTTNDVGMKFSLIPPGEFMMGSPESELGDTGEHKEDEQLHRVTLTQPFLLCQTEITKGQFAAFVQDAGFKTESEKDGKGDYGYEKNSAGSYLYEQDPKFSWKNPEFTQRDNEPVVNVSWNDAVAYCNWLSKKEGLPEYYRIGESSVRIRGGVGYRLPTEAEWEYACRAGSETAYQFGDDNEELAEVGNVVDASCKAKYNWSDSDTITADDGYANTSPVGSFRANGFGLHDMHGNEWEWCWDWYREAYGTASVSDPVGADSGSFRVYRGGSWSNGPRSCRSADRDKDDPSDRDSNLGFRVASSPFGPVK